MPAIQASHRRLEVAGVARAEVVALEQDEHIGDRKSSSQHGSPQIFAPRRM